MVNYSMQKLSVCTQKSVMILFMSKYELYVYAM